MIKRSYAKINLALNINKRYENGYHDLDMIMIRVNLYDKLYFSKIMSDEIQLSCNNRFVPTDERNLVYKVVAKFKEVYDIPYGIKVHLIKNVPMQAGLGGGSSNAAAALQALNEMFDTNLTLQEQVDFIKEFGSDIPFFLYDRTCRVSGLGSDIDIIENNLSDDIHIILIKPYKGLSTKAVYQNVSLDSCDHPDIPSLIQAVKDNDYDYVVNNIKNSLQESAIDLRPKIGRLMEEVKAMGVDVCMVSGSGSTFFSLTKSKEVVDKIKNNPNLNKNFMFITKFVKEGES